jgi:hypothetical protein
MQALLSELATNPELDKSLRDQVVAARLADDCRIVDRSIERGDLRPDIGYKLARELPFGRVYDRPLLSGSALDKKLAPRIVEALLRALSA